MPLTYQKIASTTVGSGGAASISIQNIPATYTDLCLFLSLRSNRSGSFLTNGFIGFNNATTNYSNRNIYARTSTPIVSTDLTDGMFNFTMPGDSATASTFGNTSVYIADYASNLVKTISFDSVDEHNSTTNDTWDIRLVDGFYNSSTAINRIDIGIRALDSASWVQHSTATLYGIKKS